MARTSEREIGLAVMQVLSIQAKMSGTVRLLIAQVPNFVNLTEDDKAPSTTRVGEAVWEQIVRNLKSHKKSEGNPLSEGWVVSSRRDNYTLTEAGLLHLKNKGLVKKV